MGSSFLPRTFGEEWERLKCIGPRKDGDECTGVSSFRHGNVMASSQESHLIGIEKLTNARVFHLPLIQKLVTSECEFHDF